MKKTVGVLAVQGAFVEHIEALSTLDINSIEIRHHSDLINKRFDGIILPGGESTVIGKLITELNMYDVLKQLILNDMPVLGTCAGLILLAKEIVNENNIYLGTMDIKVRRNAYGRQLGSFTTTGQFDSMSNIPMTFIRAPFIESVASNVQVLSLIDNHIVAAKQGNMIATSFHPELTRDLRIHKYFMNLL